MEDAGLTSAAGLAALAAGALALIALGVAIFLAFRLRSLRAAQRTVLGDAGRQDLVDHAARLERAFVDLREWVEETAAGIEARMVAAEERIDGCVAYRALVRYDAYNEMSGHQSSSLALLDAQRSGVVLSSILHRENARVYVKRIDGGESDLELSPEEQEAISLALRDAPAAGA